MTFQSLKFLWVRLYLHQRNSFSYQVSFNLSVHLLAEGKPRVCIYIEHTVRSLHCNCLCFKRRLFVSSISSIQIASSMSGAASVFSSSATKLYICLSQLDTSQHRTSK